MRGRIELVLFALALVCVAAIALPLARCGGDARRPAGDARRPAVEESWRPLREADPREVSEEMVRRYFSYDGDFQAWQRGVLELATDPLRSRVAAMQPDPTMVAYEITVRVLQVETRSLHRQGDAAEATVRARARAVPGAPGGEWSAPRETERTILVQLRRQEGRWHVAEMRYLD
jgi:hypothetical protein